MPRERKEQEVPPNKIFKGKSALVIGGSGGIGKEISLALSERGALLTIQASQKSKKTDFLKEKISNLSGNEPKIIFKNFFESDFSDLESSDILESARNCDILCVCFGPFIQKPLHETTLSEWQKIALFDYALPGLLVSATLPNMMKNHFGRILVFGGTGTSFRSEFRTNAAYASAKFALNALVSSVAGNYAGYGITCNAICPGFVETEYLSQAQKSTLAEKMPSKKLISVETVAKSAVFLLENSEINGEILRIDEGWSPK